MQLMHSCQQALPPLACQIQLGFRALGALGLQAHRLGQSLLHLVHGTLQDVKRLRCSFAAYICSLWRRSCRSARAHWLALVIHWPLPDQHPPPPWSDLRCRP